MALTDAYCDVADLQGQLRIDDTDDNTKIEAAINAASRLVDGYCGVRPGAFLDAGSATARTYVADDACHVTVDWFHTTAGLVVKTDDDADGTFENTWSASDYQVEPAEAPYAAISALEQRFPYSGRRRVVQITAQWGYAESIPDAVREACVIEATRLYKRRDAPFGTVDTPDFSGFTMRTRLDSHVELLLAPFRRTIAGVWI